MFAVYKYFFASSNTLKSNPHNLSQQNIAVEKPNLLVNTKWQNVVQALEQMDGPNINLPKHDAKSYKNKYRGKQPDMQEGNDILVL